jgi:HipA-like C-terminal domain
MADQADVVKALLARGIATGAELQGELKVSQPTLSRVIRRLGEQIVRIGSTKNARYALRRELPQIGSSWPIFQINEEGQASPLGRLHALARDQYWFAATVPEHSELSDGLPFFLQDLWPQGFIGRTVSKRFPELGLPERITDWNDGHVLTYLSQRGDDPIGNLLIGDESLRRYLKQLQADRTYVDPRDRENQYPILADAAIAGTPIGSSAGGEHPKFTVEIGNRDDVRHVLVKFSPMRTDRVSQRWSDLLVAEHIAGKWLVAVTVPANATELVVAGNRMFLEVERFDRRGTRGRIGIASLAAIVDRHIGRRDNWMAAAESLESRAKVSAKDAESIRRAATFGQLIGNTDMHFGNLSFFAPWGGELSLAPLYDMLPMMYAPVMGDELPDRRFETALPAAGNLSIWKSMAEAAEGYWREVAAHELISTQFAARALENAEAVLRTRTLVP